MSLIQLRNQIKKYSGRSNFKWSRSGIFWCQVALSHFYKVWSEDLKISCVIKRKNLNEKSILPVKFGLQNREAAAHGELLFQLWPEVSGRLEVRQPWRLQESPWQSSRWCLWQTSQWWCHCRPGPNVIKLFTSVIFRHSVVIPSFCVIKQHSLGNNCRIAVNYCLINVIKPMLLT